MLTQQVSPGHGTSTTKAAPGTVGVGEDDEEVADQEVDLITSKREKA